jgi:hypothetical protein
MQFPDLSGVPPRRDWPTQLFRNQQVAGSIPAGGSKKSITYQNQSNHLQWFLQ